MGLAGRGGAPSGAEWLFSPPPCIQIPTCASITGSGAPDPRVLHHVPLADPPPAQVRGLNGPPVRSPPPPAMASSSPPRLWVSLGRLPGGFHALRGTRRGSCSAAARRVFPAW